MTVYKILSDPAFAVVYPDFRAISMKTPDRPRFLLAKSGSTPFADSWVELEAVLEEGDRIPDISRLSGAHMVFSSKARTGLIDDLQGLGEWLPVLFQGETFWLFNCLNQVNQVDAAVSRLDEFDEVLALGFIPTLVNGQLIWSTRYGVSRSLFCGDAFRKKVEQNALTGLCFSENLATRI